MPETHHKLDKRADEVGAAIATDGDPRDLLRVGQVADYLGKSEGWLNIGRSRGYGPPYLKIGLSVRYRRDALISWLDERLHHSTAAYVTNPGLGRPRTRPRCAHCGARLPHQKEASERC
jgi:hypothetical protein